MKTALRKGNTEKKVSEHDTEKQYFQNQITTVHIKRYDYVLVGRT